MSVRQQGAMSVLMAKAGLWVMGMTVLIGEGMMTTMGGVMKAGPHPGIRNHMAADTMAGTPSGREGCEIQSRVPMVGTGQSQKRKQTRSNRRGFIEKASGHRSAIILQKRSMGDTKTRMITMAACDLWSWIVMTVTIAPGRVMKHFGRRGLLVKHTAWTSAAVLTCAPLGRVASRGHLP